MSRKWGYVSFRGLQPLDFAIIMTLNVLIGGYVWQGYIKEIKVKDQSLATAIQTTDTSLKNDKTPEE